MLIGKHGKATSAICTADADSITILGRDLCRDLMGRMTLTEFFYLLVTGRAPTEEQTNQIGFQMASHSEAAISYEPGEGERA